MFSVSNDIHKTVIELAMYIGKKQTNKKKAPNVTSMSHIIKESMVNLFSR